MNKWALSLVALSFSSASIAFGEEAPNHEMERSISSYWSQNPELVRLREKADSAEAQIWLNHSRTFPVSNSGKSSRVRHELEAIADKAINKFHGYKRVTCSDVACEIVLVVPDVDSASNVTKEIVNRFYDSVYKNNEIFSSTGPSMVLEGSNTQKGFSLLHFVNIS